MKNLLVVIPAIKKNAVIPDQLIKKLNGTTLIQRAINTAKELTNHIFIITDSEEISLIAERNSVEVYKESKLILNSLNILDKVVKLVENKNYRNILLYRANTPLIDSQQLKIAYDRFLDDDDFILTSVKNLNTQLLKQGKGNLLKVNESFFQELKAFHIFKNGSSSEKYKPFILDEEKSIEIESYQDWWICEKILQRQTIVFNVIGNIEIGMGHIYHSLALSHEITNHEVIFVCDEKYKIAVDKIAAMDYKVISSSDILTTICDIKPDLVINDILNTDKDFIVALKNSNIKVVNFEDLGEGSKYADIVFNELYDHPLCEGSHYLWGHKYLALRDEFEDAKVNILKNEVDRVLITFGGTDQNNLTLIALKSILSTSERMGIKIDIVCGGGYLFKDELNAFLDECSYKNIILHFSCGIISKLMENVQIAIASNGRTVYELADMNIPSIIISHHERENTHGFASLEKGFINLGIYDNQTSHKIFNVFNKLVEDTDYRKLLYMNVNKYNFRDNKQKVVQKIMELL